MHYFTIIAYSSLYILVSIISMIHVVSFFGMSNNIVMATSLAVAFELGCAASLVSAVSKNQMNQYIVWGLFIILTAFQMMGNTYFAFTNLHDFTSWSELFALNELDIIEQKRYLSIISGAILPVVALGYVKCLVDYLTHRNLEKQKEENAPIEQVAKEEVETKVENSQIEDAVVNDTEEWGKFNQEENISEPVIEEYNFPEDSINENVDTEEAEMEAPVNEIEEKFESEDVVEEVGSPVIIDEPVKVEEIADTDEQEDVDMKNVPIKKYNSLFKRRK